MYTPDDLAIAHRVVSFLSLRSRPGRPASDLAVLLFAAGLPVPNAVVIAALRKTMDGLRHTLAVLIEEATKRAPDVPPDVRQSEPYEKAEALASLVVAGRAASAREVRGHLREARQASGRQDVVSILINVFQAFLGDSSFLEEVTTLESVLYGFGAHGVMENANPDAPAVLGDGLAPIGEVFDVILSGDVFQLPDDIQESELQSTRELLKTLGAVLAAIPFDNVIYHLGGHKITQLWQPEDVQHTACLLVFMIKLRRALPLDPDPIIGAIRSQGWISELDAVGSNSETSEPNAV